MTIEEIGIIIGAFAISQALIAVIGKMIDKNFGLEKQVSNHLQHKLDEMKSCDVANAEKIVGAITTMDKNLSLSLTRIETKFDSLK